MDRRKFLQVLAASAVAMKAKATARPNVIIMLADDLGYGDVGCYGSHMLTPHIDRLAQSGTRFANFHSANPVCSPSRAGLLTGRYPPRTGVDDVLFPQSENGLLPTETTIAKSLKAAGYRTSCIGKWHLGHAQDEFWPTSHGFDEFLGLRFSNNMDMKVFRGTEQVDDYESKPSFLTENLVKEAISFIGRNKDNPYFLYLPFILPHLPYFPHPDFRKKSGRGEYGDCVAELDFRVGQVVTALKSFGVLENTIVLFLSDNGPERTGGSSGKFRGGKYGNYEGGICVPCIVSWPGTIPSGKTANGLASALDIAPTLLNFCGAPFPANPLDGTDLWPLIATDQEQLERPLLLHFRGRFVQAAQGTDGFKLMLRDETNEPWQRLFLLEDDSSEAYDVSSDYPEKVESMRTKIKDMIGSTLQGVAYDL